MEILLTDIAIMLSTKTRSTLGLFSIVGCRQDPSNMLQCTRSNMDAFSSYHVTPIGCLIKPIVDINLEVRLEFKI